MGDNNNPTMKWVDKRNRHKPCHPSIIVSFCCNQILPLLHDPVVTGFTEHKTGITENNQKQIFRAHPSYRSDTGQINSIWYDWALFEVDKVQIPCQILCFLDIGRLKDSVVPPVVEGHELKANSKCAVVQPFVSPPTTLCAGIDADTEYTSFVKWGILKEKLYLFNCDMITSEVAVVRNEPSKLESNHKVHPKSGWLVVSNRASWLELFRNYILSFKEPNPPP